MLRQKMQHLVRDERGFIISIELILIATIAVIGLLAGYTAMRDSIVAELSDVAGAVQDMNQSYRYYGVRGHSASTAGADFVDNLDYCDSNDDPTATTIDNCIVIDGQNEIEEGQLVSEPSLNP